MEESLEVLIKFWRVSVKSVSRRSFLTQELRGFTLRGYKNLKFELTTSKQKTASFLTVELTSEKPRNSRFWNLLPAFLWTFWIVFDFIEECCSKIILRIPKLFCEGGTVYPCIPLLRRHCLNQLWTVANFKREPYKAFNNFKRVLNEYWRICVGFRES